ncbi:MAG: hypothetical protein EZS28_032848 [Streblomastix strix]|uniref:Uncharacterized protein n=1 Tax=Streblomastix strix TaxID=222440 RepID=A0A5J4UN80_9EUKA|nr:MAG: hypothetical protein EZS28_032848 [Streblomastix strix]
MRFSKQTLFLYIYLERGLRPIYPCLGAYRPPNNLSGAAATDPRLGGCGPSNLLSSGASPPLTPTLDRLDLILNSMADRPVNLGT